MASSGAGASPPGWHPDPFRRFELRYWDGGRWTEHVSTGGVARVDPPPPPQPPVPQPAPLAQPAPQPTTGAGQGPPPGAFEGGGTIFTEPVLFVSQKGKGIEVVNEYSVFDRYGRQLAYVRQEGQGAAGKLLRFTRFSANVSFKLAVYDPAGAVVLRIERPATAFKSTVIVLTAQGQEIGRLVQEKAFAKAHLTLESRGITYGTAAAENWRARDVAILDHAGAEVARITKTLAGIAKELFTSADNYVLQFHRPLDEPLRTLALAATFGIDLAFHQQ